VTAPTLQSELPPPSNPEAEASLLGALIIDPTLVDRASELLTPSDFTDEANAAVFDALLHLSDRSPNAVSGASLAAKLRELGTLDLVGLDYIAQLIDSTPGSATWAHFAGLVIGASKRRQLARIASDAWQAVHTDGSRDIAEIASEAESRLGALLVGDRDRDTPLPIGQLATLALDEFDAAQGKPRPGLRAGYVDLDRLLGGLMPGALVVVAGRPSMGKTALALCIALRVAKSRSAVGFLSLEMDKGAIANRALACEAGVNADALKAGRLTTEEVSRAVTAAARLQEMPLVIDDRAAPTMAQLRSRVRAMVRAHGVRLVVIDYLQLCREPSAGRESREREVSAISRALKALARELGIVVIAAAQLNRQSEHRSDRRPVLADLRESGSIEQDADIVALVHRPAYYATPAEPPSPEEADLAEVIVAKHRNGRTGTAQLTWDADRQRFMER